MDTNGSGNSAFSPRLTDKELQRETYYEKKLDIFFPQLTEKDLMVKTYHGEKFKILVPEKANTIEHEIKSSKAKESFFSITYPAPFPYEVAFGLVFYTNPMQLDHQSKEECEMHYQSHLAEGGETRINDKPYELIGKHFSSWIFSINMFGDTIYLAFFTYNDSHYFVRGAFSRERMPFKKKLFEEILLSFEFTDGSDFGEQVYGQESDEYMEEKIEKGIQSLLQSRIKAVRIRNIRIALPPSFEYSGYIINGPAYNAQIVDDAEVSLRINIDNSMTDLTSQQKAEERYWVNQQETILPHRIEPFAFANDKYNIWACGYNFCENINKRYYCYFIQHENQVVELTFIAHAKFFERLIPLFEKIIRSVEFVDPVPLQE